MLCDQLAPNLVKSGLSRQRIAPAHSQNSSAEADLTNLTWLSHMKISVSPDRPPEQVVQCHSPSQMSDSSDSSDSLSRREALVPRLAKNNHNYFVSRERPPLSLTLLAYMALKSSSSGALTMAEIGKWIICNFPYYKTIPLNWQNRLKHDVSSNRVFDRVPLSYGERRTYWRINPKYESVLTDTCLNRKRSCYPAVYNSNYQRKRTRCLSETAHPVTRNIRRAACPNRALRCCEHGDSRAYNSYYYTRRSASTPTGDASNAVNDDLDDMPLIGDSNVALSDGARNRGNGIWWYSGGGGSRNILDMSNETSGSESGSSSSSTTEKRSEKVAQRLPADEQSSDDILSHLDDSSPSSPDTSTDGHPWEDEDLLYGEGDNLMASLDNTGLLNMAQG